MTKVYFYKTNAFNGLVFTDESGRYAEISYYTDGLDITPENIPAFVEMYSKSGLNDFETLFNEFNQPYHEGTTGDNFDDFLKGVEEIEEIYSE